MKFFFTGPVCPAGTALSFRHRHRPLMFLMKVSCVYIVLMVLSLQVLLANKGRGQNLDQINVTIGMQNQSIETLFNEIKLQTGLTFAFSSKDMQGVPTVSLARATRSVKSTLDLALVGTALKYEQVDQNVIVSRGAGDVVEGPYAVFSIRGKVTNGQGEPMPGVSVYVKETTRGTTSDAEGIYVISAEANDVLIFSFVGFKTQEVNVDARGVIDVGMEDDITSLGEVTVNAGYWTIKDKEQTGNISRITSEDIQKQPVTNPLQAMQGRMAGVYIQQASGMPGSEFTIKIRGQNSISSGNDPLYVIDGVPFSGTSLHAGELGSPNGYTHPLNNINPNDIESIEVLKDADATAIYGSRGANGVVLITTKRGKSGKTSIDLNVYSGVGKVGKKMSLLNTKQYLEMRREAFSNDEATPQSNDFDINGTWDTTRYTDWQKKLIGGASNITNAQLSISGGNTGTQFKLGGTYQNQSTVLPGNNEDHKASGHATIAHTSTNQKLKINFTANYLVNSNNLPRVDPTYYALTLAPNAPSIYTEKGDINWADNTWNNPISSLLQTYKNKTTNLISNSSLDYAVIPSILNLRANLGYNLISTNEISTAPKKTLNPAAGYTSGFSQFGDNSKESWIAEPQAIFNKTINSNSNLNIHIGGTFQEIKSKSQALGASNFASDALLENIKAAGNVSIYRASATTYKYAAFFGRLNYNFKEKYIINITARRDGSSRFGPGKQFANFGAMGLAWIFSKENFFTNKELISFGKLRGSYGTSGNDQIGDYGFFDTYTSGSIYQGVIGLKSTRLFNTNYGWELTKKLEAGIEIGLIKDKILWTTSYFNNKSSNQLVYYNIPPTTGFTLILDNFPATVQNSGWELEFSSTNLKNNKFHWTTSINATFPKNKLTKFPGITSSPYATTYSIGSPLTTRNAYVSTGVNTQTGIYSFLDTNDDGLITYPEDLKFSKSIKTSFFGGFQNSITYRNLQLDIFFQFVKQTGYDYIITFGMPPGSAINQPDLVLNRWRKPGDRTTIQKFTQSSSSDAYSAYSNSLYLGDGVIVDASFIRLKNVSLSYSLTSNRITKLGLQKIKLFIQGQNLLTITKYKGLDPEISGSAAIPPLRMLTGGIQISI